MAFTNSFRMERVYFERLKSMIDILKPYLNTETDEKLKSILENSIDDNGSILLLYRNLGECWAELSDLIKKADEKIDSLDDKTEEYHDELNERIDEVNNYIMGILREIEARLEAVEQDLATLSRNIILDLERVNDEYTLSYKGDPVDFAQLAEWVEFPDNVIVRGVVNGEETVFHLREFDTDETSGVFEFFATGLIDNVVHEIMVTVLPDDSVNVATVTQTVKEYTAGNGINISSSDEISVDFDVAQEKLAFQYLLCNENNNINILYPKPLEPVNSNAVNVVLNNPVTSQTGSLPQFFSATYHDSTDLSSYFRSDNLKRVTISQSGAVALPDLVFPLKGLYKKVVTVGLRFRLTDESGVTGIRKTSLFSIIQGVREFLIPSDNYSLPAENYQFSVADERLFSWLYKDNQISEDLAFFLSQYRNYIESANAFITVAVGCSNCELVYPNIVSFTPAQANNLLKAFATNSATYTISIADAG